MFRGLRFLLRKNKYQLPRSADPLERIRIEKVFFRNDLRFGDQQVRIMDENVHKTALEARYGSYEFAVVPNTLVTFMCLMNNAFRCCRKITEGYFAGKSESMYRLWKPAWELVVPWRNDPSQRLHVEWPELKPSQETSICYEKDWMTKILFFLE